MRSLSASLLFLVVTLPAACAVTPSSSETSEDELRKKAFGYTCTTSSPTILDDAKTLEIAVAESAFRFTGSYGPNLGTRDRSYRSPSGTSRLRFNDFAYGGDCVLKLVVDAAALKGAPTAALRVQCSTDDEFLQDLYTCSAPHPARIEILPPAPPTPPHVAVPPAATKKWACAATDALVLGNKVVLQVDDAGMRLVSEEDLTYEGTRDTAYRSRSGAYVGYEDFGYGGDCSLTAVVEEKILRASTTSATLKVRCKGDDFLQDTYSCKPQ